MSKATHLQGQTTIRFMHEQQEARWELCAGERVELKQERSMTFLKPLKGNVESSSCTS
jgi:hypothetical protein